MVDSIFTFSIDIAYCSYFNYCAFIAENLNETLRKELMDVRRQLGDSTYEKEKYNSSNKELREHVKRIESEKREQNRTLEEAYQKIAGNIFYNNLL